MQSPSSPPLRFCPYNGYLVNGEHGLSTDPTDHDVKGLPTIGCNRLKCSGCNAEVTSFASSSAGRSREYKCLCDRWTELHEREMCDPDAEEWPSDPKMPWSCAGHPVLTLPCEIDGAHIASRNDLGELVRRALFLGELPPGIAARDRATVSWLARLHSRLDTEDAAELVDVVRVGLDSDLAEKETRERVLKLIRFIPFEAAAPALEQLLDSAGDTSGDDFWWALRPLIEKKNGRALDRARAQALTPNGGAQSLYSALSKADPTWMMKEVEAVARATPSLLDALIASFALLSKEVPRDELRNRARLALAPSRHAALNNEPFVKGVERALLLLVTKASITSGVMPKMRVELSPFDPETVAELEVWGVYKDTRYIELHLFTSSPSSSSPSPSFRSVRERFFEGPHSELRSVLNDPTTASKLAAIAQAIVG